MILTTQMNKTMNSNPMPPRITLLDKQAMVMIDKRMTYAEMATIMNLSAKSGVFRRIEKLIKMGLVEKDPLKSRSRRLTEDGRRVLREQPIVAGSPTSK